MIQKFYHSIFRWTKNVKTACCTKEKEILKDYASDCFLLYASRQIYWIASEGHYRINSIGTVSTNSDNEYFSPQLLHVKAPDVGRGRGVKRWGKEHILGRYLPFKLGDWNPQVLCVHVYIISHRHKRPWSGMQYMFAPVPVKLFSDLVHEVSYDMGLKWKNKVRVSE